MQRYKEVLEKPLEHIQRQPKFKKNKRLSKLAAMLTLIVAALAYGLVRPLLLLSNLGEHSAIRNTLIVVGITFAIGLGIVLFKLYLSKKLLKD